MTCYPISGPDGRVTGFICKRGERKKRCVVCGNDATRLCDFQLAGKKTGKTCDAQLCERCVVRRGSVDYCSAHARKMREADAWLAELIESEEEDANKVDRDALYKMFPDWDCDWYVQLPPFDERHGVIMVGENDSADDVCPNCFEDHAPMEPCYGGFDPDTDPSETEILGVVGDR